MADERTQAFEELAKAKAKLDAAHERVMAGSQPAPEPAPLPEPRKWDPEEGPEMLARLRMKYPQYDFMEDAELAFRVTERYPQYKNTGLIDVARPWRQAAFGEIKAAPSRPRELWETFKANLKGLSPVPREGESLVGGAVLRPAMSAAGLANTPFEALGKTAGTIYEHMPMPGLTEQQRLDQVHAMEQSVELAPQVATGAIAGVKALDLARRLVSKGAAKALGLSEAPLTKAQAAARAARQAAEEARPKRPWTEEAHAPYTQEWSPLDINNPLNPRTPFDKQGGFMTAGQLALAGRTAAGAVIGQEAGETAIDKIRYGAVGAVIGGVANPFAVKRLIAAGQSVGTGPSAIATASAKWKAKAGAVFTPLDISRGMPVAKDLVERAFAWNDATDEIRRFYSLKLDDAFRKINYDPPTVNKIMQSLDGYARALSPLELQVQQEVAAAFGGLAQGAGRQLLPRLSDTFKDIRKGVHWRYGLPSVMNDVRNVAKHTTTYGGFMPDGTPVPSFRAAGNYLVKRMIRDGYPEEVVQYYRQYVNELTQGPKPLGPQVLSPETAQRIKAVEFMRTIGFNFGSATSNALQQINTLAEVTPGSFARAYYDMLKDPRIVDMAEKLGIISEVLRKADIETFASATKFDAELMKWSRRSGYAFQKVEEFNRVHAFAAGLRDAEKLGLKGQHAIQYARNIVDKTQFRFGPENAPTLLRGGNPLLNVIGQYKSYQVQQTLFLKNLVADDIKTVAAGRIPTRTAKYIAAVTALVGPDAITGHHVGDWIRSNLAEALGGDPADYKWRGLIGSIGISLAQQIGIGALPMENLQSLVFLLPGPALSHVFDTLSLVFNKDFSLSAATRGEFGQTLTPDQWTGLATRYGSVELDKVRRAIVWFRATDFHRESNNLSEALGLSPATGPATLPANESPVLRGMESLYGALGIKNIHVEEAGQARQEAGERIARWKELTRLKARAHAAGDEAEVNRINRLAMREFKGKVPSIRHSAKEARKAQQTPALERQLRKSPKQIRQQLREEVRD